MLLGVSDALQMFDNTLVERRSRKRILPGPPLHQTHTGVRKETPIACPDLPLQGIGKKKNHAGHVAPQSLQFVWKHGRTGNSEQQFIEKSCFSKALTARLTKNCFHVGVSCQHINRAWVSALCTPCCQVFSASSIAP